jgi:hypothetical protein
MTVHLVGSVPLSDSETVFRTVAAALGPHLVRLPDGETGIRQRWIRFLQDVLASHPAIAIAADLPPFKFTQWDGTIVREIPRLRVKPDMEVDPTLITTGYADMAIESFVVFDRLQRNGDIPAGTKFQVCIPSPLAPIYNNLVPADRPKLVPAMTRHFVGEVQKIADRLPNDRLAVQWDVCQEVLAWEGYYEAGSVPFERETIEVLTAIGNAVPPAIELGYHLCYGSPADEHLVQPKDTAVMVEIANRLARGVTRPIDFVHMPVPKPRTDDAFFEPLRRLQIPEATDLYLGLIHHDDHRGDDARMATARRYARFNGVATECGWGRGDPARVGGLLSSLARAAAHHQRI